MDMDIGDPEETVKVVTNVILSYVESDCRVTLFNKCCVGKLLRSNCEDEKVSTDIGSKGKLVRLNFEDEKVCIDIGSLNQSDVFLFSFSHRSYLPIRLITTNTEPFTILHHSFSSTMLDYISTLKSKSILPVLTYEFPIHTEEHPNIYKFISEEFRLLTRDLVDFVLHLQSIQESVVQLGIENLCIVDGRLKIWGIRFRELDIESAKEDFKLIYNVINEIFKLGGYVHNGEKVNNLPSDFDDLLNMMFSWSAGEPIKNHFGILSAKEKVAFIRNIGDFSHGLCALNMGLYSQALDDSGSNHKWKQKVTWGPLLNRLNFQGSKYVDWGGDAVVNINLICFCRNAATHLHEDILACIHGRRTVESLDLECYIMQQFSRFLTNFKKELDRNKIGHIFQ